MTVQVTPRQVEVTAIPADFARAELVLEALSETLTIAAGSALNCLCAVQAGDDQATLRELRIFLLAAHTVAECGRDLRALAGGNA